MHHISRPEESFVKQFEANVSLPWTNYSFRPTVMKFLFCKFIKLYDMSVCSVCMLPFILKLFLLFLLLLQHINSNC